MVILNQPIGIFCGNKLPRKDAEGVLVKLNINSTNFHKQKICDPRPKVELAKQNPCNLWQKNSPHDGRKKINNVEWT